MRNGSDMEMKVKENQSEESNEKRKKKKVLILFLLIGFFSLITFSFIPHLLGRIGTAFRNEGSFAVGDGTNDSETIQNRELQFDASGIEVSVSDTNGKISFTYHTIKPTKYTCMTSDAEVATCYVSDGYVVVNPKMVGTTTVTLQANANGKLYTATAKVTVVADDKYVRFSSTGGTINLATNREQLVTYTLNGIKGNVVVKSSDDSVATVTEDNGVVKITAHKIGSTDITISINYNGKDYTNTYALNVINQPTSNNNVSFVGKKSSDSTLSKLTISNGTLNFNPKITSYSVIVGKDVKTVGLSFKTNSSKSKVVYTVDGVATSSLNNIPLQDGAKEVVITVTAEDGSTTSYTVIINRETSNTSGLTGIEVSEGTVTPVYGEGSSILSYTVTTNSATDSIDIKALTDDPDAKVHYLLGNTIIGKSNILKKLQLHVGTTTLKIVVTNKHGIPMIYFINIMRDGLSKETGLGNLEITGNNVYTPVMNSDGNKYSATVSHDESSVSLSGICKDLNCTSISVTYKDGEEEKVVKSGNSFQIDDVPLKEGMNEVSITVTAADGKTKKTYTLEIYKPIRKVVFDKESSDFYVEDSPYSIKFKVVDIDEKNLDSEGNPGVTPVADYNVDDVLVSLSNYTDDFDIHVSGGSEGTITLTPKNSIESALLNKGNIDLIANYNNHESKTNLNFDIKDYEISSDSLEYDMTVSGGSGEKNIIFTTNIFNGRGKIAVNVSNNGKKMTICTSDENGNSNGEYCVEVAVDSTNYNGNVTLSYANDATKEESPRSLPITVTADEAGQFQLVVSGSVFGKSILKEENEKPLTVKINVTRKYLLELNARYSYSIIDGKIVIDEEVNEEHTVVNGKFNKTNNDPYRWELEYGESIDLSEYDVPYLIDKDCKYHKFKGYSTTTSEDDIVSGITVEYKKNDDGTITGTMTGSLIADDDKKLYAIYESEASDEEIAESNTLWLVDVPLFHNKKYYEMYHKDKIIYPGAYGSYIMNFKNESSKKIVITGITLKEQTICVDQNGVKGCLNMGYIMKLADGSSGTNYMDLKNNPYYFGESVRSENCEKDEECEKGYWILNSFYDTMTTDDRWKNVFGGSSDIVFDADRTITMEPNSEIAITIFWKWVEIDAESDKVDTLIGNQSASSETVSTLNDKYNLSVGINFETEDDTCEVTGD